MNEGGEDGEDERREPAIASTPSLHANFDSKLRGVSRQQLSKFQELHRRRLQIKEQSKTKKKAGSYKSQRVTLEAGAGTLKDLEFDNEDQSLLGSEKSKSKNEVSLSLDNSTGHHSSKKRQKLYWGLDTRERWERKANM